MGVFLSHLDLMPLLYGILMFVGLCIMWHKLVSGRWLSLIIDISVFTLVFWLHGGSMRGGFSAMIAALLAGLIFPLFFRSK